MNPINSYEAFSCMDTSDLGQGDPAYYEIRVRGRLDPRWAEWFDGLTISHDAHGDTTLAGVVADQAALYSLISRARDLGLTLLAIQRHQPAQGEDEPS